MNATALAAAAREHAGPTGPRWWPPVARHVQQLGSWIRAPQRAVSWAWTAYKPQPGPMEWQLPDTNEPKTLILMRIRMVCIIWSLYLMVRAGPCAAVARPLADLHRTCSSTASSFLRGHDGRLG